MPSRDRWRGDNSCLIVFAAATLLLQLQDPFQQQKPRSFAPRMPAPMQQQQQQQQQLHRMSREEQRSNSLFFLMDLTPICNSILR